MAGIWLSYQSVCLSRTKACMHSLTPHKTQGGVDHLRSQHLGGRHRRSEVQGHFSNTASSRAAYTTPRRGKGNNGTWVHIELYWFLISAVTNSTAFIHSQIVHWTKILSSGATLPPVFRNNHLSVLASEAVVRLGTSLRDTRP